MEPDNEAACSPAKAGAFGNAAFFSSCGRQRCPSAELPKAQHPLGIRNMVPKD